MMLEITSFFHGFDVPQHELLHKISLLGWTVEKIQHKDEGYEARLKNEHGQVIERLGNTPETALAHALIFVTQLQGIRSGAAKGWTHLLPQIAYAYAIAPTFDYKAAPSWKALADDNAARAKKLQKELEVTHTHNPVPYPTGLDMAKDIQKGKIQIPAHDVKHPIWTPRQVLEHRLVHSVLGIAPSGGAHNWVGTNMATARHLPYLSNHAKQALFVEEVGRRAYQTHYQGLGPQKICHLKDFLDNDEGLSEGEDVEDTRVPWIHKGAINKDWEMSEVPFPNPYLDGDPLDSFELEAEARRLHTGWDQW